MDTNETKIYTAILIAAGVLGIILVYFIITIIRQQRKNLSLHNEKIQAEITTLENERKRIASDLHDDLGPLLSAVKLHITSVDTPDPEDQELIKKSGSHIDTILERIREISKNLMPQVLIRKGLVVALREFIDNLTPGNSFDIQFIAADTLTLESDKEIHVYRIIMEIIHNAIRHSRATALSIEIRKENNKLILLAADNGTGFEYHAISKSSLGLGLKNILSRVEILKGELYVESDPDKGTKYTIEIPV